MILLHLIKKKQQHLVADNKQEYFANQIQNETNIFFPVRICFTKWVEAFWESPTICLFSKDQQLFTTTRHYKVISLHADIFWIISGVVKAGWGHYLWGKTRQHSLSPWLQSPLWQ